MYAYVQACILLSIACSACDYVFRPTVWSWKTHVVLFPEEDYFISPTLSIP